MGDVEANLSGLAESPMKHHLITLRNLTLIHYLERGQWLPVSLTGAVSSKIVTEERYGNLSTVGTGASSVWVEGCLTARHTRRADTKVGPSDPVVECGIAIAQRTKGTPGITG